MGTGASVPQTVHEMAHNIAHGNDILESQTAVENIRAQRLREMHERTKSQSSTDVFDRVDRRYASAKVSRVSRPPAPRPTERSKSASKLQRKASSSRSKRETSRSRRKLDMDSAGGRKGVDAEEVRRLREEVHHVATIVSQLQQQQQYQQRMMSSASPPASPTNLQPAELSAAELYQQQLYAYQQQLYQQQQQFAQQQQMPASSPTNQQQPLLLRSTSVPSMFADDRSIVSSPMSRHDRTHMPNDIGHSTWMDEIDHNPAVDDGAESVPGDRAPSIFSYDSFSPSPVPMSTDIVPTTTTTVAAADADDDNAKRIAAAARYRAEQEALEQYKQRVRLKASEATSADDVGGVWLAAGVNQQLEADNRRVLKKEFQVWDAKVKATGNPNESWKHAIQAPEIPTSPTALDTVAEAGGDDDGDDDGKQHVLPVPPAKLEHQPSSATTAVRDTATTAADTGGGDGVDAERQKQQQQPLHPSFSHIRQQSVLSIPPPPQPMNVTWPMYYTPQPQVVYATPPPPPPPPVPLQQITNMVDANTVKDLLKYCKKLMRRASSDFGSSSDTDDSGDYNRTGHRHRRRHHRRRRRELHGAGHKRASSDNEISDRSLYVRYRMPARQGLLAPPSPILRIHRDGGGGGGRTNNTVDMSAITMVRDIDDDNDGKVLARAHTAPATPVIHLNNEFDRINDDAQQERERLQSAQKSKFSKQRDIIAAMAARKRRNNDAAVDDDDDGGGGGGGGVDYVKAARINALKQSLHSRNLSRISAELKASNAESSVDSFLDHIKELPQDDDDDDGDGGTDYSLGRGIGGGGQLVRRIEGAPIHVYQASTPSLILLWLTSSLFLLFMAILCFSALTRCRHPDRPLTNADLIDYIQVYYIGCPSRLDMGLYART